MVRAAVDEVPGAVDRVDGVGVVGAGQLGHQLRVRARRLFTDYQHAGVVGEQGLEFCIALNCKVVSDANNRDVVFARSLYKLFCVCGKIVPEAIIQN